MKEEFVKYFLLMSLVTLTIAACQRKESGNDPSVPDDKSVQYETVAVRSEMGTKATFDESNGEGQWQIGDCILVQRQNSEAAECEVLEAGTSTTIRVPLIDHDSRAGYAYYPSNIVSALASREITEVTVTLPDTYNNYVSGYSPVPMYADNSAGSLVFRHLCAMVRFKIILPETSSIDQLQITFPDKHITGEFPIRSNSSYYEIRAEDNDSGESTVTYNFDEQSPGTTMIVYVPVPVGDTYSEFTINAYRDGVLIETSDLAGMYIGSMYPMTLPENFTSARGHGKKMFVYLGDYVDLGTGILWAKYNLYQTASYGTLFTFDEHSVGSCFGFAETSTNARNPNSFADWTWNDWEPDLTDWDVVRATRADRRDSESSERIPSYEDFAALFSNCQLDGPEYENGNLLGIRMSNSTNPDKSVYFPAIPFVMEIASFDQEVASYVPFDMAEVASYVPFEEQVPYDLGGLDESTSSISYWSGSVLYNQIPLYVFSVDDLLVRYGDVLPDYIMDNIGPEGDPRNLPPICVFSSSGDPKFNYVVLEYQYFHRFPVRPVRDKPY